MSSRELIRVVVFRRGSEGDNRESSARRRHGWAGCLGALGSIKGNLVCTAFFLFVGLVSILPENYTILGDFLLRKKVMPKLYDSV
jgi:hypothetical protein